ncbi:hypothetical protein Q3G72_004417 [Acer saccharum]|nr:hypothetical protein Q3G72_004417 [Acer saccharum]
MKAPKEKRVNMEVHDASEARRHHARGKYGDEVPRGGMTIRRHLGPNKELEGPRDMIVQDMERLKEKIAKMKTQNQGALTR